MVEYRKDELVNNEFYHICSKSIAGYIIFNNDREFFRMLALLKYYQIEVVPARFSHFIKNIGIKGFDAKFEKSFDKKNRLVRIVAYCLMPTHVHLILEQLKDEGISRYMSNVLNSYSRYFNTLHKRKGPLWQGRFKSILVDGEEQLVHLTRYIHLNPTTSQIVRAPQEWIYSSYREYLERNDEQKFCLFDDVLEISAGEYKKFCEDRISYQQELAKIKSLVLE